MSSYYGMQVMIIQKVLIIIQKGNAKEQDPEGVEQTKTKTINILIVKIMNKRIIKINNIETVSCILI